MAFSVTKTGPRGADWRRRIALSALLLALLAGCSRSWEAPPAEAARSRPFRFVLRGHISVSPEALENARFVNVAEAAGLRYQWQIPGRRPLNILQTIGNGCAFLDYDNDGWLDILLVGPQPALFRNKGVPAFRRSGVQALGRPDPEHPLFEDVTAATGLDRLSGHFLGCAVGDYDNDGFPDLYLSGYRTGLLLRNEAENGAQAFRRSGVQDSRPEHLNTQTPEHLNTRTPERRVFRDVTGESGLAPQPWGTSAAFVDVDGDGWLDLYVCNYVDFGPDTHPQLCVERGVETACEPQQYNPLKGVLYRNVGVPAFRRSGVQDSWPEHPNTRTPEHLNTQTPERRVFRDVTHEWGADRVTGKALGVAPADYEGRGRPALAIANDEMPGDLLRPTRRADGLRYENVGVSSGTAYDRDGNVHAGMGIDWGDYNNDGWLDLFVTTFANEPRSLYRNDGKGQFADLGMQAGFSADAAQTVAFGCKFFDYDNDGWLDILIANGHVQDNIAAINGRQSYRQPTQLFHNTGGKYARFEDVSRSSSDLMRPIVGRGLAVGDYDNDGRLDALVVDSEGKPLLLHNETGVQALRRSGIQDVPRTPHHWLGVRLIGTKSNRSGYGAILKARIGGRALVRQCQTAGSYLSASDPRVHFGLGEAKRVDALTIRWPSGRVDTLKNLKADRYVTVREGVGR